MVTAVPSPSPYLSRLAPGGLFRQYLLLEQIGVGGQAVVWSALGPARDRIFAIKFNKLLDLDQIQADETGAEQKLEKLLDLRHAHILPILEYGYEENVNFTVSPYIAGGTLTGRIRAGRLTTEKILRYGSEIASALDYLHSQGVIHRDLKASNILLDGADHTYLADFGLARFISSSTLAFHTGHGTPPYAPPEQIRSKQITPKSDIFSFGILLFEMFTGQLPWNGQRQLGVEQLHSDQQLPDLREYVPDLPVLLPDVLRRVTSASEDLRPRSAGEVMRMIYYVFDRSMQPLAVMTEQTEPASEVSDAQTLLRQSLPLWESSNGTFNLGLTKFALIDLQRDLIDSDHARRFMLSQALTYGHHDDQWWATVSSAAERLRVASTLLGKQNETIAGRVLGHLMADSSRLASAGGYPESLVKSLLALGTGTADPQMRQQIFRALRVWVRPAPAWNDPPLPPEQVKRLGELALEDSESGDRAAELIGHLRASPAVRSLLSRAKDGRALDALAIVQHVAGSLPAFVPDSIKFRLGLDRFLQRLTNRPIRLIGAYGCAFLGAAIGVAIQVYLTINLPSFFDLTRLATSLERGLIVGSLFGLGIFAARLMTERFRGTRAIFWVAGGALLGGVVINLALLVLHILFLHTPPAGPLFALGCLWIALTFAVSGLLRSRLAKITISSLGVFTAILGTWLLHVSLTDSALALTPLFRYDYSWPLTRVMLTAFAVALPMGVFGNLIHLRPSDGLR